MSNTTKYNRAEALVKKGASVTAAAKKVGLSTATIYARRAAAKKGGEVKVEVFSGATKPSKKYKKKATTNGKVALIVGEPEQVAALHKLLEL